MKLGINQEVQFQPMAFNKTLIERISWVDPSKSSKLYSWAKSPVSRIFPDFDNLLGSMANLDTAIPANSMDSPSFSNIAPCLLAAGSSEMIKNYKITKLLAKTATL